MLVTHKTQIVTSLTSPPMGSETTLIPILRPKLRNPQGPAALAACLMHFYFVGHLLKLLLARNCYMIASYNTDIWKQKIWKYPWSHLAWDARSQILHHNRIEYLALKYPPPWFEKILKSTFLKRLKMHLKPSNPCTYPKIWDIWDIL